MSKHHSIYEHVRFQQPISELKWIQVLKARKLVYLWRALGIAVLSILFQLIKFVYYREVVAGQTWFYRI